MSIIPDDLMQYLRTNKLDDKQKKSMRELVSDVRHQPKTAVEYAEMYTRRAKKIKESL